MQFNTMSKLIINSIGNLTDSFFSQAVGLFKSLSIGALFLVSFVLPLRAQVLSSSADTGRMAWGHKDFSRYDRPSMCDRAAMLTGGYETRKYDPDTILQIREDVDTPLPEEVVEVVKNCLSTLSTDSIDPRQTWSLVRAMLAINEDERSRKPIDKLLVNGKTRADTMHVLGKAMTLYLEVTPTRLDLALYYARLLDSLVTGAGVQVVRFNIRNNIANHWMRKYVVDSVKKYASEAIKIYRYMDPTEQDMVPIHSLFGNLINIANERGDVAAQEAILDTARELMSEWRQDDGRSWLDRTTRSVDIRRSMYGRKTQPLQGAFWLNNQGVPRPTTGKISLVVMVNHNCGTAIRCVSQFIALKRLQAIYGDKLDLTLISVTQGYAPASGVLTPREEAEAIAKYFTGFHKLSAAILVDEAPVYTIEDGRVLRDLAPIVHTFNELGSVNAILTDSEGRIRWLGNLRSENDRKPLVLTINRILEEE